MKQYLGIIFSTIYALLFRILVEFNIVEINSWTYIIFVPIIIGFIPFILDKKVFLGNKLKSVFFPIISVSLFLVIAFVSRLEDLGCAIFLFPPYAFFSVVISMILRTVIKDYDDKNSTNNITKNSLLIISIPILLGNIEKLIEKRESQFTVSEKIIIDATKQKVWTQLFSVPDLTNYIENSAFNYLGFPNPVSSQYDKKSNVRLGYFSNGIILNESVEHSKELEELTFKINVEKSKLEKSRTFSHILKNENLIFNSIKYQLRSLTNNSVELTLVCDYKVKSNLPFYGEFWSKKIILDFETKLLNALKKQNENTHVK
ncbi:hypothetical protein [Chryseobacterium wangxinyae]|uniref:hypothetical protein n=1 Tax=Chryseobacterium sp. CY353 TaxID=2997334 RepID=UPI00226F425E|nr:hypothetical protein [Chryseobacterium sp. CY353]MCY0971097.1 hypothetical protein [Chryseobacterium sp. CY353]